MGDRLGSYGAIHTHNEQSVPMIESNSRTNRGRVCYRAAMEKWKSLLIIELDFFYIHL